jgi:fructokinase
MGRALSPAQIGQAAVGGDAAAAAAMSQYVERFARSLALVVNILDPDAIVLGGGMSNIEILGSELPHCVETYSFMPESPLRVLRNLHGDSSGVRGAAWLWGKDEFALGAPQ